MAAGLARLVPVLLQYFVQGAGTANTPRTAPIAEVLTLTWVEGLVQVPLEIFSTADTMVKVRYVELFRASAIWQELVKSRILLFKICKPQNSKLNMYILS